MSVAVDAGAHQKLHRTQHKETWEDTILTGTSFFTRIPQRLQAAFCVAGPRVEGR
jgi:hypothetical protein